VSTAEFEVAFSRSFTREFDAAPAAFGASADPYSGRADGLRTISGPQGSLWQDGRARIAELGAFPAPEKLFTRLWQRRDDINLGEAALDNISAPHQRNRTVPSGGGRLRTRHLSR